MAYVNSHINYPKKSMISSDIDPNVHTSYSTYPT